LKPDISADKWDVSTIRRAATDTWSGFVGPEGSRAVAWPATFALLALALLVYDHVQDKITHLVFWLCVGLIGAVFIWLVETARRKTSALAIARRLSHFDVVSGLPDRASLVADLASDRLGEGRQRLVMIELDGLQSFYDGFGAVAGDELVAEMAGRLIGILERTGGMAYRVDSSRFAVLAPDSSGLSGEALTSASVTAGKGDSGDLLISRSHGEVLVPDEAADPETALRLAGQRVSASKQRQQRSARRQAHAVLMAVLAARRPDLRRHLRTVAFRAISVSRRLGLPGEDVDDVFLAAELQDIGMLTVPEVVLEKREALDENEAMMIRNHPVAGAGIVATAPGLGEVARIIRAISERYDGSGYPDHLAADRIPVGARVIAVCVAYAAMTTPRPYRAAQSSEAAVEELRRCAGSQFDPQVVDALVADIEEENAGLHAHPAFDHAAAASEAQRARLTVVPGGATA